MVLLLNFIGLGIIWYMVSNWEENVWIWLEMKGFIELVDSKEFFYKKGERD